MISSNDVVQLLRPRPQSPSSLLTLVLRWYFRETDGIVLYYDLGPHN